MKRLFLVLLLVLFARLPLGIWNELTAEDQLSLVKEIGEVYAEQESCHKIRVSSLTDKEFIYFQFECLEKRM